MKIVPILILAVFSIFVSACRKSAPVVTLHFPDAFHGPVVFQENKDGLRTDTKQIDLAIPADGIVPVQSVRFFYHWSSQQAIRTNGDVIPLYNDEPYNARKVGIRLVYSGEKTVVFAVGTQSECDELRHRSWE